MGIFHLTVNYKSLRYLYSALLIASGKYTFYISRLRKQVIFRSNTFARHIPFHSTTAAHGIFQSHLDFNRILLYVYEFLSQIVFFKSETDFCE